MKIRDRIKELRRVKASELRPNPRNWRTHPQGQQDALRGLLARIGYAGALSVRELPDGRYEIIDGHLRAETTPDMEVPVLVLDVDEAEAKDILTTFDPLGAMAEADQEKLGELLDSIEADNAGMQSFLDTLGGDQEKEETKLVQLDTQKPPAMSWVLVGIPTVRFGEIAADVERIAVLDDVVVETTVNDG